MKYLIFFFSIIALLSACPVQAQQDITLALVKETDSTYLLSQIIKYDGKKVGSLPMPENGQGMKKAEFQAYLKALISSEQERLNELERLKTKVAANVKFLSVTLDSIAGKGTYDAMQNERIKGAMQGAWTLVVRGNAYAEPEILTLTITGDVIATKDKTGALTWKGESFTLQKGGLFNFPLTFTQAQADRYVSERTDAAGVTTKYILRR